MLLIEKINKKFTLYVLTLFSIATILSLSSTAENLLNYNLLKNDLYKNILFFN